MVEFIREIPLDPLVYELGGLVFFFALLGFAHTTRRLLYFTGHGALWLIPLAGALCMVAVVGIHFYANVLYPLTHSGDPGLMKAIYRFRFIALLAMLASSIATVSSALVLWALFSGSRVRG